MAQAIFEALEGNSKSYFYKLLLLLGHTVGILLLCILLCNASVSRRRRKMYRTEKCILKVHKTTVSKYWGDDKEKWAVFLEVSSNLSGPCSVCLSCLSVHLDCSCDCFSKENGGTTTAGSAPENGRKEAGMLLGLINQSGASRPCVAVSLGHPDQLYMVSSLWRALNKPALWITLTA